MRKCTLTRGLIFAYGRGQPRRENPAHRRESYCQVDVRRWCQMILWCPRSDAAGEGL